MSVDPDIAAFLPLLAGGPELKDVAIDVARRSFRTLTVDLRDHDALPTVRSSEDVAYPAANGPRRARVHRPETDGVVPTILYAHGGAFIMGDLDTHEDHARLICHEVGAVVVSIDYRLAPESPFPAGHLDVVAAMRHVVASARHLGGDPARVGVAGDSAGANLVAGAAIAARDEGLDLAGQLLLYPPTDFVDGDRHGSREQNKTGFFLTEADMRWSEACYAADAADHRASVLAHPDLSGVAPAVIATAGYDPLRDEGEAYAQALREAGVPVVLRRYARLIHGFFGMTHLSKGSAVAARELCADFKELLG